MQRLTAREERLLQLRFGQGPRSISQRQAAAMLGVSLRTAQQAERHALRLLRLGATLLVCGWDEV